MKKAVVFAALLAAASSASATTFTRTSPSGGLLPAGVTEIGGIVLDLTGTNGTRVVSQLAASSLYQGYSDSPNNGPPTGSAGGNPLLIGTQTGFSPAVVAALGGGLLSASVRFTLFDGDTAPFDFDDGDNTLELNGVSFGNWSTPVTQYTSDDGLTLFSTGTGFGNEILSTGFFQQTNALSLAAFFSTLSSGSVGFSLNDVDPTDNYYDFTRGIDGGLINVGQGPVVTPPGSVPEPASWAMMLTGFGLVGSAVRRRRVKTSVSFA